MPSWSTPTAAVAGGGHPDASVMVPAVGLALLYRDLSHAVS